MQVTERMAFIRQYFGVDFIHYDRPENGGVLLASGCGIGMGLMDWLPNLSWFVDVDAYRTSPIDWECVAVIASMAKPTFFLMAGWFSLDRPTVFRTFERGICGMVPFHIYIGGKGTLDQVANFVKRYDRICTRGQVR
jgi:hypothetical protein